MGKVIRSRAGLPALLIIVQISVLFVVGCRTGSIPGIPALFIDPANTVPYCSADLSTIEEEAHLNTLATGLLARFGPPQSFDEWASYYPIGTTDQEWMYWNRQDTTHAVYIDIHEGKVTTAGRTEFPAWALNPALLKPCLGMTAAAIERRLGAPSRREPAASRAAGAPPTVRWFYSTERLGFGSYVTLDIAFDHAGRARWLTTRVRRPHAV